MIAGCTCARWRGLRGRGARRRHFDEWELRTLWYPQRTVAIVSNGREGVLSVLNLGGLTSDNEELRSSLERALGNLHVKHVTAWQLLVLDFGDLARPGKEADFLFHLPNDNTS